MAKAHPIDETDRRILAGLKETARRPNADIAHELGISESTVRKRIARLIDDEVIRIAAVANPLRTGYPVVAIFGLQCVPSALREVEEALSKLEEFRFIGLTSGAYDFAAEAWFESMDALSTFITERLGGIEGIRQIQTANVLKMVRYTYDWGTSNSGSSSPSGAITKPRGNSGGRSNPILPSRKRNPGRP